MTNDLGTRPTSLGTNLLKANDSLAASFSDVSIVSPALRQGLIWTGSAWVNGRTVNDTVARDMGFLGYNYDPAWPGQSNTSTGTAGVIYLARVELPDEALTITNMHVALGTIAATVTNCFIGIYDSAGTRQMLSANQAATGAWTSTTTQLKTIAGASTWVKAATKSAFCWVATVTGSATTMPGFFRAVNAGQAAGLTTGATSRWGTILTGQTTLPTTITPGSIAVLIGGNVFWAGIS